MTGIKVHRATIKEQPLWDAYTAKKGSFFHRFGWGEVIKSTYGHDPLYLYAERVGEIVGILPLIDRRSPLLGRALISVGFTVGGGIIADEEEVSEALLQRATKEARARGVDYIELRDLCVPHGAQTSVGSTPSEPWTHTGVCRHRRTSGGERQNADLGADLQRKQGIYDNFSMALAPDVDARLKAIPRKKRADVRKAITQAEEGALSADLSSDVDLFWRGYAAAQRDHGTPVFPKKWLSAQAAAFGDAMEITFVHGLDAARPLAGVITYYHREVAHLYHAFISPEARRSHAGEYLYWWMMGRALERGARIFDLGRSKVGTGSHAYKTYWGMEPRPMVYRYKMLNGESLPNVNPQNPKFARFVAAWRHLPLPVANRLGPLLAGHFA